ncbi:flagellar export protein FliJ [Marinilactibacillus sp. Marseille-P9653]|uniref:flagellar export protein FliJ n=1 Tax=Marinilactibacillus sp. Marseille-P9653 TaxID=2866583 RepID=UPI001CE4596D|nr:flagellar export protein FliJ [Marinilactibacillus sp. Marseille-P9653]
MQAYQFSMSKILDWREDLEEAAQKDVKSVEVKLMKEQQQLEALLRDSRKIKSDNLFKTDIDSVKRHSLYKDLLDDKIIQQKNRIHQVEIELEAVREKLKSANKDKRMMIKLEEKERLVHTEAEKKEEQKQLDEISTLQFGRNLALNPNLSI